MTAAPAERFDTVRDVIVSSLDLALAPSDLSWSTPLFGVLPELDSLGVVALVAALEDRFGIFVDDEELGEELFETVGTVATWVDVKLADRRG